MKAACSATRGRSIRRKTQRASGPCIRTPNSSGRGVGRLVLALCEDAARAAGFGRVELMATLAGEPLYRASGYAEIERVANAAGATPVPLVRMGKSLG